MKSNIARIAVAATFLFTFQAKAQDSYLDTSFGTNGIAAIEKFEPNSMIIQQDCKILVGGAIFRETQMGPYTVNSQDYIVYRFNTDGTIDSTFGTAGKFVEGAGGTQRIADMAQMPDGRILLLGSTYASFMASQSGATVFMRLNADGTKDTSFGNNGTASYQAMAVDMPSKMIVLPDQKVIVAGGARSSSNATDPIQPPTFPVIARYNADLTRDLSFNGSGYKLIGGQNGTFRNLAINADGDMVAGFFNWLYKFDANGQPIVNFGTNGQLQVSPGDGSCSINQVSITEGDKLYLTGSISQNSGSAMLARLLQDGSLDSGYGISGKFVLENNSGEAEAAIQSVFTEDGIITGLQSRDNGMDFGLLITTLSGAAHNIPDDGRIVTSMNGNQRLKCIAMQSDGKVIMAGLDDTAMILARYDLSGILRQPSFSEGAISVYPNPAIDSITVKGLPDGSTVELYNVSGQKVLNGMVDGNTRIDITGLPQGIYFLNTSTDWVKIIKN